MINRIIRMLKGYAWFKRLNARITYEALAKYIPASDWHFMNYGYSPFEHEKKLKLNPEDEIHRYAIQLYHYLASKVTVEGMDVLEIGSGRGGGCNYIKRYFNPRKITGLDIAVNAVNFSKQNYRSINNLITYYYETITTSKSVDIHLYDVCHIC